MDEVWRNQYKYWGLNPQKVTMLVLKAENIEESYFFDIYT